MTTIKFAQDNIFEKGIGKYDLCVFYGHHNMAFGLGYSLIKEKYKEFKITENPFETMPSKPIIYADKKAFVCVPHDFMSNENLRIDLTYWLKYATDNNLKTIAITGVRDIAKKEIIDINLAKENDNNRVTFIVETLKNWLIQTKPDIREILLIAISNNYTRNYNNPIYIN